jgi:hypothetical protein
MGPGEVSVVSSATKRVVSARKGRATRQQETSIARFQLGEGGVARVAEYRVERGFIEWSLELYKAKVDRLR